mmetsp:Transcript_61833/g.143897  ORF Transcript_61833/g.143897 Transcript_61833/m.143897 type:complete len:261 (-) Transcript_61833:299-1081(-)|eukprot:CAMPEP_0171150792 /NCGR_PEP_ID=MMETSP0766_2-20121228/149744_1 /TAXON_ID=439317 /ORGANISM="Gambierdiscus australes, Strain CAWD 149" /LENGTH=260 /DNA_ID=CAMNT_0011614705 /DNA_START=179 /DNA_END=961 /DNA_ORIENTATION=+
MLFSPDLLLTLHGGPPPQAVINKRPLWFLLMTLLGATLLLRMAAFDIMGGLLCGLLLLLACVIVRDGMKELPKFSLIFGMLCGINFFFYILPLLSNIVGGRSERRIEPVESVTYSNTQQLTYTLTVKTTPFFDKRASLLYNIQSAGMLTMPLCMLLGAYLGVSAHQEVQRHSTRLLATPTAGEEDGELGISASTPAPGGGAAVPGRDRHAGSDNRSTNRAIRHGAIYGAALGRATAPPQGEPGQKETRKAFQGTAHKLGD